MTVPWMPVMPQQSATVYPVAYATEGQSAASSSVTIPGTGTQYQGYLAVLIDYARASDSTIPTAVTPSGWTNDISLGAALGVGHRLMISRKVLGAADSGASITGMLGTGNTLKRVLLFNPNGWSIAAVAAQDKSTDVPTDGDPASQTITASGGTAPLVVVGVRMVNTAGGPIGFPTETPTFADPSASSYDSGNLRSAVGGQTYDSDETPVNHTIDGGDSGTGNIVCGLYYELTPA